MCLFRVAFKLSKSVTVYATLNPNKTIADMSSHPNHAHMYMYVGIYNGKAPLRQPFPRHLIYSQYTKLPLTVAF